ncbi:hypothetical protein [Rhizobacter sp. Root1221]|uniref:hypothetical protein n=1 Tax=Rhizobacter sp. Root1221 TaxID=1736433 RepID=UPI0006FCC34A|nr:hypothetical protein [Rhizobacter sp. Root1221]KQW02865.1 hypothetical protein ASC87_00470 [Rhizobacter sp. Root1221]
MNQPILRPALAVAEGPAATPAEGSSAYPQKARKRRPGWKPTLVRANSFKQLQAIQKSTTDPAIDLSYLTDACVQMALEQGSEAIVQRVFDGFRSPRKPL